MKYYLISDSKNISEDIEFFEKYSTRTIHEDGIIVMYLKVKLFIDEGMDRIDVEIT